MESVENMKRIKLAYCLKAFEVGGIEKYIKTLLSSIDRNQFEPILYCNHTRRTSLFLQEVVNKGIKIVFLSEAEPFEGYNNIKVMQKDSNRALRLLRDAYHFFMPINIRRTLYIVPEIFRNVPKLHKEFLREKIDVIHFNSGYLLWLLPEIIAARLANIPQRIVTIHNCPVWRDSKVEEFFHKAFVAGALTFVNKIIAVSETAKDVFVSQFKLLSKKVTVIHNGLNFAEIDNQLRNIDINEGKRRFFIEDNSFTIGMIARLGPEKGHKFLIESAKLVKDKYPLIKINILLAGDGPVKEELIRLAVSKGVYSCIKFLGHTTNVYEVISVCDIVVLPSLMEGLGFSLIEGMACYKAVIATDIGGMKNVVDGSTGILVPLGNSTALAEAIVSLMRDRKKRKEMGLAGRKKVEALFRQDEMIRKTVNLYN